MVSLRLGGNSIKGGTYICQHHLQTASDYTNLPRKRPTQPHNSHPTQPPRIRLHNGINEMRRSNSHTEHIASVDIGLLQNPLDDCVDARGHIRGSGRFAAQIPRDGLSVSVVSMMAASVLVPPTSTPMRYIFILLSVAVLHGCEDVRIMSGKMRRPALHYRPLQLRVR